VNYAGVYGARYEKFLETSGLPDSPESEAIFDKIKNLYSGVEKWKQDTIRRLYRTRRVVNVFGRVRQFNEQITPEIEREAINWVIQSAGHDILIIFVLELVNRFREAGLNDILLTAELHDEPVFDASAEEYAQGAKIVEEVGLGLNQLILACFGVDISVPIFAECKVLAVWK
jgi:DNA polymerase I-like protein with 3'-5' exonuclease and polymerase domains